MLQQSKSGPWRRAVALALAGLAAAPLWCRAERPTTGETVTLAVDHTEAPRRIFHSRLAIPARPGPLTLCYPKWVPGTHAPVGPITDLGGLVLRAGDKVLPWRRDDVDPYSFHCRVPEGAAAVEVALDLVLPAGRWAPTPRLAVLNWNQVLIYPKDRPDLRYRASLRLPPSWTHSTALAAAPGSQATTFEPVSLDTLIDSPVLCGAHLREIHIGPAGGPDHLLVLACDGEEGLNLSPALKAGCDRLVAEAYALFGTRHYRSYRFLLALSDRLSFSGLEHHESSDNHAPERALLEPFTRTVIGHLLSHEYVHSWNGKFRRPADMVTADFQQPERTRLLWVYEGLTDYLAIVLASRSGLMPAETTRDYLAMVGEMMNNQRGRTWRPLDDTAAAAPLVDLGGSGQWLSWRRSTSDYYDEGVLLWLEADMRIRSETKGQRSLDDFCRRFFGGTGGAPRVSPYNFDDVAAALEAVAPGDWKTFLRRRVTATSEQAPLEGIRLGGWKLTYADKPSDIHKGWAAARKRIDLSSSLGLWLGPDGTVSDVVRGKPADRAGVSPGMKLLAVNGRRWTQERLTDALEAARKAGRVVLLLEDDDFFRTFTLEYQGGPRFPRLARLSESQPDLLSRLLRPLVKETKADK
jgi:predicted metalloprotease with PDZ domain